MKKNINDLYFGIKLWPLSFSNINKVTQLEEHNLFDISKVKWSVAKYASLSKKEKENTINDPLVFCFSDVWARCEYEFVVCPWGGLDENDKVVDVGIKADIFEMYVKPNAKLLMEMINSVSVSSAKKYLAEERKRFKRLK